MTSLYSIAIWLDEPHGSRIDGYRTRWDKHYPFIGPHVTVLFPIRPRHSRPEIAAFIADRLSTVPPFELSFDSAEGYRELLRRRPEETESLVGHFPDCRNMVAYPVREGAERLLDIRRRVGGDEYFRQPDLLLHYPHYLAVGHDLSDSSYEDAIDELRKERTAFKIPVAALHLIGQTESGKWETLETFELDGKLRKMEGIK